MNPVTKLKYIFQSKIAAGDALIIRIYTTKKRRLTRIYKEYNIIIKTTTFTLYLKNSLS